MCNVAVLGAIPVDASIYPCVYGVWTLWNVCDVRNALYINDFKEADGDASYCL